MKLCVLVLGEEGKRKEKKVEAGERERHPELRPERARES